MSDTSQSFPPARARSRSPENRSSEQPAALEVAAGDDVPAGPVDGAFELTDYLSRHEAGETFSELRAGVEAAIAPRDFIERLWTDEIVTAEWEGHRLRSVKKILVELGMAKALEDRWRQSPAGRIGFGTEYIPGAARGVIEGDPQAIETATMDFRRNPLDQTQRLLAEGYLAKMKDQLELERVIQSCGQRRDAIITRLYGRRELLRNGHRPPNPTAAP